MAFKDRQRNCESCFACAKDNASAASWRGKSGSVHRESDATKLSSQANLVCAGCGKPLDSPLQSSMASPIYCQSCLRLRRGVRDRDLPDIYDLDLKNTDERADYDIHPSSM
jgi:late competence protein required for DNA uptake (superfamily II DNA/RNA helicase)